MQKQRLNPESLQEGIQQHYERRFSLSGYQDNEVEAVLGPLSEKLRQGFQQIMIVYKVYAPFFLSQLEEIIKLRQAFIQQKGGPERVVFQEIKRTGEIVVLFK